MIALFRFSDPIFISQDAHEFGAEIQKALHDLLKLLSPNQNESNRTDEKPPEVKKDL